MDNIGKPTSTDVLTPIISSRIFGHINERKLEVIKSCIEPISLKAGSTLFEQGTPSDAMYMVTSGCLSVHRKRGNGEDELRGKIRPGEPTGEIQFLTGGMHTASLHADEASELIKIPRTALNSLTKSDPDVLSHIAEYIHRRLRRYRLYDTLPKLFGKLDEKVIADIERRVEWKRLNGGELLFKQGETGDSLYVVISGRLKAVIENDDGSQRVVGEITRGESVGEMALFTGEERSATVCAVRDTELIRFSKLAFEEISKEYPQVVMQIAQILIHRLRENIRSDDVKEPLTNIALVGADINVDLNTFTQELVSALSHYGQLICIGSEEVDNLLGTHEISQTPPSDPNSIRLETWLDDLETEYSLVVYKADQDDSEWTRRCLRQADRILIVADALKSPEPKKIETKLLDPENSITACCRQLVLLHTDDNKLPDNTISWLKARTVDKHFHLRTSDRNGFQRLARLLTGRGIGLVLGGGGARGYAHIGVIRALEEAGIPIDMIGGTSMGAVIAAAHAMGFSYQQFLSRTKYLLGKYRPFKEYTLPIVSILKSKRLDQFLHDAFGDAHIEDLWLNFFCVSTNLSAAEVEIHDSGSLWDAVRASMSVPGVAVPVVVNNNLFVDGGILNNLPGDIMKKLCTGTVIAVDVSSKNDLLVDESCTPIPPAWKIIWSRINPFIKTIKTPTILSVLGRASLLGSINKRNEVMREVDLYLNPPVSEFGMLDNDSLENIAEAGYRYAKKKVAEWLENRRNPW
jgi:NTE family protein/lysophospholipid hydrolase